jgi:hypothetical protein
MFAEMDIALEMLPLSGIYSEMEVALETLPVSDCLQRWIYLSGCCQ